MDLDRPDVKGILGFALDAIVIDDCLLPGDDLGHGVRKVVAGSDERLDDRDL